jgi:uncharacterized protein (DUF983 family)
MEKQSAAKKRGRYDCPACGERIKKLVRRGTFLHPISHCPNCGARISSDFFYSIPSFGLALLLVEKSIMEVTHKHEPAWAKLFFLVLCLGLLLLGVLNLVRVIVKGPYRLISGGTENTAGGRR